MSQKMNKKAEHQLTDGGKFPIETCRERICRTFGMDAVALSGPSEGANLADSVCRELSDRWDHIKSRYAGDDKKVVRLALKMAESFSHRDDTDKCVTDLSKHGFDRKASKEIAEYLKAYAMPDMMTADMDGMMDDVDHEADEAHDGLDGEDDGDWDDGDEMGDEDVEDGEVGGLDGEHPHAEPDADDFGGPSDHDADDMDMDGDKIDIEMPEEAMSDMDEDMEDPHMVTLHLPKEVAHEILDHLKDQIEPEPEMEAPGVEGGHEPEGGLPHEDLVDMNVEEIPGEPEESQMDGGQTVVSHEGNDDDVAACMGGPNPEMTESIGISGEHETDGGEPAVREIHHHHYHDKKDEPKEADSHEDKEDGEEHEDGKKDSGHMFQKKHDKDDGADEDKDDEKEESKKDGVEKLAKKEVPDSFKSHQFKKKDGADDSEEEHKGKDDDGEGEHKNPFAKKEDKEAMSTKKTVKAYAEMGSGNKPISEKEKAVEAPKPLDEGNIKPEGYMAGGTKVQNHETMGREQKFDPHTVTKSEVSKGDASLMGPDESFPKDGPDVPAGSAPIHGEQWEGGNVSTKGTVIAVSVVPEGITVRTPKGSTFLAKASIKEEPSDENMQRISKAVGALDFDGDGAKFAGMALKAAKTACKVSVSFGQKGVEVKTPFEGYIVKSALKKVSKAVIDEIAAIKYDGDCRKYAGSLRKIVAKHEMSADGEEMTDTSKLEADDFTNHPEKKASEQAGKSEPSREKDGEKPTDTSKKEADDFQNDPEKPSEAKKEASKAPRMFVKKAADKPLDKPEPAEENIDPVGENSPPNVKTVSKPAASLMGREKPTDFIEVKKGDVAAGDKSRMGPDENKTVTDADGPKVPAQDANLGYNSSTGGTLASVENEKRNAEVKLARFKAAAPYVADLLRNGDITEKEYAETLDKYAQMPVQAIQALMVTTRNARAKAAHSVQKAAGLKEALLKEAGVSMPFVISSASQDKTLKDKLVDSFRLTERLNSYDELKK